MQDKISLCSEPLQWGRQVGEDKNIFFADLFILSKSDHNIFLGEY